MNNPTLTQNTEVLFNALCFIQYESEVENAKNLVPNHWEVCVGLVCNFFCPVCCHYKSTNMHNIENFFITHMNMEVWLCANKCASQLPLLSLCHSTSLYSPLSLLFLPSPFYLLSHPPSVLPTLPSPPLLLFLPSLPERFSDLCIQYCWSCRSSNLCCRYQWMHIHQYGVQTNHQLQHNLSEVDLCAVSIHLQVSEAS